MEDIFREYNNPIISVIVPVYNSEKYIKECIDSILNQTFSCFELVCVDDGSVDNSVLILDEYEKKDPRVRTIKKEHREGEGAGAARNMGLENASGEYVMFLDSDDFFEPILFETLLSQIREHNADLVICDAYSHDSVTGKNSSIGFQCINKDYIPQKDCFSCDDIKDVLFLINGGIVWGMMIRRSFITNHNIYFQATRLADDMLFVYTSFAVAERITVCKKKLVYYRANLPESQSAKKYDDIRIMFDAPLAIKQEFISRGIFDKYARSFYKRMISHAMKLVLGQKDSNSFEAYYDFLKNEFVQMLGLDNSNYDDSSSSYGNYFNIYKYIKTHSSFEFLYDKAINPFVVEDFVLPECIKNKKLAIYGAGKYGKAIFGHIWKTGIAKIVIWVDSQFETIGYPVQSPLALISDIYDYIIVSQASLSLRNEIIHGIQAMGIDNKKIIFPEVL